jgi:hypothetical protein
LNKVQIRNRLVAIGALLFILLWAGLVDPDRADLFTCFFLEKTGYPCPTCGMSRSFYETFHFNFQKAFQFHHLGPVLVLILLIVLIKFSWEIWRQRIIQVGLKSQYLYYLLYVFGSLMMLRWVYVLYTTTGG